MWKVSVYVEGVTWKCLVGSGNEVYMLRRGKCLREVVDLLVEICSDEVDCVRRKCVGRVVRRTGQGKWLAGCLLRWSVLGDEVV